MCCYRLFDWWANGCRHRHSSHVRVAFMGFALVCFICAVVIPLAVLVVRDWSEIKAGFMKGDDLNKQCDELDALIRKTDRDILICLAAIGAIVLVLFW